ncbi:class II fructose-bisphosphate aldolase [Streptacidiphilus monticola]|uniref:Ketose-bisphosphate aldolase n=1 Tax=Streptacidiphilus monticola TaxID=2161674 RepID=A0ABW1G2B3_9ACTN
MPLVATGELVTRAAAAGTGICAFNVVQLEHAEALVAAAEKARLPVILQLSQNTVRYHGGMEPIGLAMLALARRSEARVAVHLDHAEDPALVAEAVALGFGSVMFDASTLPYAENEAATREAAELCHRHGVWLEAELGEVGGKDGVHAPGARTDPAEAARFVRATGVDALAVAVGSSHAMTTRDAELDFDLIACLRAGLDVPLVLHGSSGVSDEGLVRGVRAGLTKVNIATHLNRSFTAVVREVLAAAPAATSDPRTYLGPARDAVADEAARLLRLLAAP